MCYDVLFIFLTFFKIIALFVVYLIKIKIKNQKDAFILFIQEAHQQNVWDRKNLYLKVYLKIFYVAKLNKQFEHIKLSKTPHTNFFHSQRF